jgi:hypothetical protein
MNFFIWNDGYSGLIDATILHGTIIFSFGVYWRTLTMGILAASEPSQFSEFCLGPLPAPISNCCVHRAAERFVRSYCPNHEVAIVWLMLAITG